MDEEKLKRLLDLGKGKKFGEPELVLTGRDAAEILRDAADYLTEMSCVRHPYKEGTEARRGIEF